jgi:hypothetical protein
MPEVQEAAPLRTLREIMLSLHTLRHGDWVMIPQNTKGITLDLPCRTVFLDDYLDEEIENYCTSQQVRAFFYSGQLEDIRGNLAAQRANYSDADLEAAIDFYWRRDAFIQLT